jgi:hypothetical protein
LKPFPHLRDTGASGTTPHLMPVFLHSFFERLIQLIPLLGLVAIFYFFEKAAVHTGQPDAYLYLRYCRIAVN